LSRFAVHRFCGKWSLIVVAAVVSVMVSAPTAAGVASDPGVVTAANLMGVGVLEVQKLDMAKISHAMSVDGSVQLTVLGSEHSFTVRSADLGEEPPLQVVGASSNLANARFFKGTDDQGNGYLRATVTPQWMHFSLNLNGQDYVLDPADGTGDSGYYALYSSSGDGTIDMSNDVAPLPADTPTAPTSYEPPSEQSSDNESAIGAIGEPLSSSAGLPEVMTEPSLSAEAQADSNPKNKTCRGGGGDPEYRVARIILACDIDYRNRYPSDWPARMASRLNDVCGRFESQVAVTFKLAWSPHAIPSDHCQATNSSQLMNEFRTYMQTDAAVKDIVRDVSHLCTGKDLDGSTAGKGSEPGVGSSRWGSLGDLAYSISEQWHDDFMNMWVMGHELGHNFNGDHNYWGWIGASKSWMSPTYGGAMTGQFTTNNANRVRSWAQQTLDLQRSTNPGPSSVSTHNLQSSNLAHEGAYIYFVANQMTVSFEIKNVGTTGLTLNWLFVGARDASGNNRDFGHVYNVWLGAGSTYHYSTTYSPQSGGMWSLWPAYKVGTSYGPYQWLLVTPTMYYDRASWSGMDDYRSLSQVDLFYRFHVLTTSPTSAVGSSVTVFVSMYDGVVGTGTNSFNYLFVGCRNAAQVNKDFGLSGQQTITQKATSGATGGGYLVFASRTLDSAGTWTFWPAYLVGGVFGPYEWHKLTLTVS